MWVLPLLNVRYCFKLSSKLCANLRKHNEPMTQFFIFFFTKTWLCHSLDIMNGQLSSCTKSEKTNDPILKKLSDGWAGGLMDESDFMGGCPTNVERPVHTKNVEQQFFKKYFLAVFL